MKFTETPLPGAYVVELQPFSDDRGFFARAFCAKEFAAHDLNPDVAQANLSYNARRGTLRGMHYQTDPAPEAKLERCLSGALYDVIVDLRRESPTHLQWFGIELTPSNGRALFVPECFAHGFLTLADDTLAHYQVSEFYTPTAEAGLRYDDPAIGIEWPHEVRVISDKDASWPPLQPAGGQRR